MLKFLIVSTCLTTLVLADPIGREVAYNLESSEPNQGFKLPAVCKLPLEAGSGDDAEENWHFDDSFYTCEKFTYKGEGGNPNRFASQDECLAACSENPCPAGSFSATDGRRQSCTFNRTTNGDNCPTNAFCMIPHNVCCAKHPSAVDICAQPKDEGRTEVHSFSLPRHVFFFNAETDKCESFQYKGLGGNQNRFADYKSCLNACKASSVCPNSRRPFATANGPVVCEADVDCPTEDFVCRQGRCCSEPRTLPVDFDGSISPTPSSAAVHRVAGLVVSVLFVLASYF